MNGSNPTHELEELQLIPSFCLLATYAGLTLMLKGHPFKDENINKKLKPSSNKKRTKCLKIVAAASIQETMEWVCMESHRNMLRVSNPNCLLTFSSQKIPLKIAKRGLPPSPLNSVFLLCNPKQILMQKMNVKKFRTDTLRIILT